MQTVPACADPWRRRGGLSGPVSWTGRGHANPPCRQYPPLCCLLAGESPQYRTTQDCREHTMSFKVGIGIVTYNRREILSDTIDKVRAFTRQPDAALVVAD